MLSQGRYGHQAYTIWTAVAAIFVLVSGGLPAMGQSLPPGLEGLFRQGVAAQRFGELDKAEKVFLRVLAQGGKTWFVYNNLGIVYQLRHEHERAVKQFREAMRLNPENAGVRVLAGASLLALGKTEEAIRELEQAVALEPREPLARQQLARACNRAGNLYGAVDQLRALRELAPSEPEYAYQLGRTYLRLAGWSYQEVLRLAPRSARAFEVRAENLRAQGRADLALRAYERAVEADPKLPGLHLAMGRIFMEQGMIREARSQIERELEIVPESAEVLGLKQKLGNNPAGPP